MKFIGCFNKSVLVTYLGVFFSLTGIFNLLKTSPIESVDRVGISMIFFILAGICDLFDGFIARKCSRNETQKQFGIQIDSLSDIISFLIYPIILLFYMVDKSNFVIFSCIAIFYVITGITRLAWFNMHTDGHTTHYQGLPVTFSAFVIPILYVLDSHLFHLNNDILMLVSYFLLGFFFILNIKIKKPDGMWYSVFSVLAVIIIGIILF